MVKNSKFQQSIQQNKELLPPPCTITASLATTDICGAHPGLLESGDLGILALVFKIYCRSRAFSGHCNCKGVRRQWADNRDGSNQGGWKDSCDRWRWKHEVCLNAGASGPASAEKWLVWCLDKWLIRDVDDINACEIGVRELASVPRRPTKKRIGQSTCASSHWRHLH